MTSLDDQVDEPTAGDQTDDDDDVEVLPWWRNPWNLGALAIAIALLGVGIGVWWGTESSTADPNEVDVGFLQDMRSHHEQAVNMGLLYLDASQGTGDPTLRLIAREIITGQSVDVGRMVQLLRGYGKDEANMTDQAMAWMDEPVPLDRMPGLASDEELQALRNARGTEADLLFIDLMTAHHQGGIHMAEHAAEHAGDGEVRSMAAAMRDAQRYEVQEMATIRERVARS